MMKSKIQIENLFKVVAQQSAVERKLNVHNIPKFKSLTINIGVGKYMKDGEALKQVFDQLYLISGQKPCFIKAKQSEAAFQLQKGKNCAIKVTIRDKVKIFSFLEKLLEVALPSIDNFRGFKKTCITSNGVVNLGISTQQYFPEIVYSSVNIGMGINLSTNILNKEFLEEFLVKIGFPIFR